MNEARQKQQPAARPASAALLSLLQDAALVGIFALFAVAQTRLVVDGVYRNIPFAIENSMLVVLFLTRRRSRATSTRPFDWAIAAAASWLPLAFQTQHNIDSVNAVVGTTIQTAGLSLSIIALGFLGRSIGIVAADRGLKTSGAYRVVRHPAYAAHVITSTGFLVANPHWINAAIWVVVVSCQVARIHAEERFLLRSTGYADYQKQVRWRLVPRIY